MINRRELMQMSVGAGASFLLGSSLQHKARAQSAVLAAQKLNPTTLLVTGSGGNVLVKKAANGDLLAVDGGLEESAGELRKLIETTLDSNKFTTLINTHWHREQTGLNLELGNRTTTIFAHENTRQWLSTRIERPWEEMGFDPLPENARPNEIFYHYGSMPHGTDSVEYGYLRPAHT